MDLLIGTLSIVLLTFLSALFSSAEIALVSISLVRAEYLANNILSLSSKYLLKLKQQQENAIITILIGNNLVNIASATIATSLAISAFGDLGVALSTGAITLLILTFGEIIPKTIANKYAENYMLLISVPLYYTYLLLYPLVVFFRFVSKFFSDIIKAKKSPKITEEELEALVDIGVSEGEIDGLKKEIITNVFDLSETTAKEIMVPRVDIFAVEEDISISEFLKTTKKMRKTHTRIPIYNETLDNITGVVLIKDIYKAMLEGKTKLKLKDIARKPYFVPSSKKIDSLLEEMKKNKQHMAILVDEHGGVEGIVTFEDLLEEIVGEIYDEDEKRKRLIRKKGNAYYVDGELELAELEDLFDIVFDDVEADRVSGLIAEIAGKIPKPGESVKYGSLKFEVVEADEKKIKKVKITKISDNHA